MPKHGSTGQSYVPSTPALRQVTQGAYKRAIVQDTTVDLVGSVGTEVAVGGVGTHLIASGTDVLYSWFRIQYQAYSSTQDIVFEYMLLRMKQSDPLPDLNTSSEVEALQKDKRILDRGIYRCMAGTNGKTIAIEKYNVKVPDGEYIQLVVRPINEDPTDIHDFAIVEWRAVGTSG